MRGNRVKYLMVVGGGGGGGGDSLKVALLQENLNHLGRFC